MKKVNYAKQQRLRTLEVLVQLYGEVGPRALVALYGISTPCATKDFQTYRAAAPDNLSYGQSAKAYVKGPNFQPIYGEL